MTGEGFHLYDFLEVEHASGAMPDNTRVWKAARPVNIEKRGLEVYIKIPFYCLKQTLETQRDHEVDQVYYEMRLAAYGNKVLRCSLGIAKKFQETSEMLQFSEEMSPTELFFEKYEDRWQIMNEQGEVKARFNFGHHAEDHWSDLLPPPDESFEATFFPDGKREVKINAFDQFFPARQDAIGLGFIEQDGLPQKITYALHADAGEHFVGTGERFGKMDLSGHTFDLKNRDGQGVNNRRTYKNIPFYLSSKGYGAFTHSSYKIKLSLADYSTRSVMVVVDEPLLDLFLIADESPDKILYHYKSITGFPAEPPLWSYGIWMSRMTYFSEDEVMEICDRLREEEFPCDVIHLDTGWFETDWLCEWKFNKNRFPDPPAFIKKLNDYGLKVSLWQMPYIAEAADQYEEAISNKYIGAEPKTVDQQNSNFSTLDYAGTIDFTYPKATEWYKDLLRNLLKMGVSCIKTDFGEDIHMDAKYEQMESDELNNLYGLLYQKAAFEVTKEVTGESIIWARAGWAGCQRYPLHWGGDAAATWDGLAGSLKGGLHIGLSGFGYWSHDVPGFHGQPNFMNAVIPDDLYLRWTQFGVFTSHIRYHGTSKREPYHYPNIKAEIKKWWRLRYALIPYILEQAKTIKTTGFPLLRAMLLHHPDDRMCWHLDDQYFFGSEFLVAPVMNAESTRDVYLPEGDWIHFFSGEKTTGPKWIKNLKTPLGDMPVFVREGAEIPIYPKYVAHTGQMDFDHIENITISEGFPGIWQTIETKQDH